MERSKFFLIILLLLTSCERIFQDGDDSYVSIDSEQEKEELLNGIYHLLSKVHDQNYFYSLQRSDDVKDYYYHPRCGASNVDRNRPDLEEITGKIYKNLYSAIITINGILNQLNVDMDKPILGECYFLRAYCYFKLARFFGTPPIITDVEVNFGVKKPSYTEVYSQIEADLLKAIDLLPIDANSCRIQFESPHIGTAKALLAEVYLSMAGFPLNDTEKYMKAASLAGDVIANSDIYNFKLLDDFAHLWREENKHHSENVFSLFFNGDLTDYSYNSFYDYNYNSEVNSLSFLEFWSITELDTRYYVFGRGYAPERSFFAEFPDNHRKQVSYSTGYYRMIRLEGEIGESNGIEFVKLDPINSPCIYEDFCKSLKWVDLSKYYYNNYYDGSNVNIYLLRYAQTLLTFAEAKSRIGEVDEAAYDAINFIRRRANCVDLYSTSEFDLPSNLTQQQFIDSVVSERAWELCNEPDGRWFDIIRLDLKQEIADKRFDKDKSGYVSDELLNKDWYFYLIPQEDRWLNPNLN